jgi:hypothetical protein
MSDEPRKPVLSDHKRLKKRLVPPLVAALGGNYSPYSWARELVPEFLWIALMLETHGIEKGTELCADIGLAAAESSDLDPKPLFATLSSFSLLSESESKKFLEELDAEKIKETSLAIRSLNEVFAKNPLHVFETDNSTPPSAFDWVNILQDLYDRHSRRTALVLATAMYMGLAQHKIVLTTQELVDNQKRNFENIVDYPDTEESKIAASSFRASAPMFLMASKEDEKDNTHTEWLEEFWSRISRHGECIPQDTIPIPEHDSQDQVHRTIYSFCNAAKTELKTRLSTWSFDLNRIEVHEVIGALLARQTTLATEFAMNPGAWTPYSAPLFLRAMADVHITVAWILGSPDERSKKYVEAGLGEVKLEIAHRKQELLAITNEIELNQQNAYIEHLESWLQSQRLEELVEVNLGSWSGINIRKMAEEAGCVDFYNYVYQPFSSAIHSSWHQVSSLNTVYCQNPSHRYHRLPAIEEFDPSLHWLTLAAKYLQRTFAKFDEETGVVSKEKSAYQTLLDSLRATNST